LAKHVRRSAGAWRRSVWVLACILYGSAGARANGAFPDEFSVHFQPNAPSRILVGANFGLVISEDEGATWRYSCEPWIVAGSNAAVNPESSVSFYNVAADGVLLAQAVNVTRSADGACTWPTATGALEGQVITDTFASPTDPNLVLATVAIASGSYVVASRDGGKTFDPTRLYETSDLLSGVEVSKVDPNVVYATQVSTFGTSSKLVVSTAGGAVGTWQSGPDRLIPTQDGTQPRIFAVDPADKDKVYLRLLRGTTDAVAITSDGGKTYENPNPLSIDGRLSAFLRAGDGTLYVGTMGGVLYVRPPSGGPFVQQLSNGPKFRCLAQRPGGTRIYACGDSVLDGYSLYFSDDGAQTFRPMMKFTDIQGPLTCGPVQSNCAAHWERIQGVLGLLPPPDAGQVGEPPPPTRPGGSHCSSLGAGATALLVLLTFSLWRRARPSASMFHDSRCAPGRR